MPVIADVDVENRPTLVALEQCGYAAEATSTVHRRDLRATLAA